MCFNCLKNHFARDCKICFHHCREQHYSVLHEDMRFAINNFAKPESLDRAGKLYRLSQVGKIVQPVPEHTPQE